MRRPPPWWPQGEEWSPHGPPWRAAPRHFRRRFLLITLGVLCLLMGLGFVMGMNSRGGPRPDPGDGRRGGPWNPFGFAAFVLVVGGGATVRSAGRDVRFTVTDSGPGIPADRIEHLFERTAPSADSRGSGLGLSIARDLVRAHGGSIRATNGTAGGAVVSFDIPVARQP